MGNKIKLATAYLAAAGSSKIVYDLLVDDSWHARVAHVEGTRGLNNGCWYVMQDGHGCELSKGFGSTEEHECADSILQKELISFAKQTRPFGKIGEVQR